jgi:hypothetical protein
MLALQGIITENIKFKGKSISNDFEIMQMLVMAAPWLDSQTILEKMPLIEPDEVELILQRKALEDVGIVEGEPDEDEEDTPPEV